MNVWCHEGLQMHRTLCTQPKHKSKEYAALFLFIHFQIKAFNFFYVEASWYKSV